MRAARHIARLIVLGAGFCMLAPWSQAQEPEDTIDAAEADAGLARRKFTWNSYEGPYFTARVGGGFLYDYLAYSQDDDSKQQMTLRPVDDVRDFRVLVKGGFPKLPRLTYTIGYMYDVAAETWRWRQTGLMFDVPELHGNFFLGRSKEGFSTSKIMVGYHGWTNERAAINDALLPILADGIKWMATSPKGKLVYSFGWFEDTRTEYESFNKNDNQFTARAVLLPYAADADSMLHLSLGYRYGEADDGQFRYRSKPESSFAQTFAIDTGSFPAHHANTIGVEAFFQRGPFMAGTEYYFHQVRAEQRGDPYFHGGEVVATYILTGETRPYNRRGAFFQGVIPSRSVFEGGPGAWEVVLRLSYADLDSGPIDGGKFWRLTPMVSWYLSEQVRFELAYGYSELDRFGVTGGTQFFQTRIQFSL